MISADAQPQDETLAQLSLETFVLPAMDKGRLLGFSDGIFTFTATLLIIFITLPELQAGHLAELPQRLWALWPQVLAYVISFCNIANYWKLHYGIFTVIERVNDVVIYLNILLLLVVTFLPFPTELMGRYGTEPVSVLLYGGTIFTCYVLLFAIARYAYHRQLTQRNIQLPIKRLVALKLTTPMACSLTGMILAGFFPSLSLLFYSVCLLINVVPFQLLLRGYQFVHELDAPVTRDATHGFKAMSSN